MSRNNSYPEQDADFSPVGGQAVIEGVMMRNGDTYGIAVRMPNGKIRSARYPWYSIARHPLLLLPFIRGFPVIVETIINGIHALNQSVALYECGQQKKVSLWESVFGISLAVLLAILIFIIAPHMLAYLMHAFNLSADVNGFSFHLWDGLFKCAIFIIYIWAISFIPDIRRVYEYHGAEHKTIHAYESGSDITSGISMRMSRLHPRCGTTFFLFVICISIIVQALTIPLLLLIWTPQNFFIKHLVVILYKLALIIPISAVAYELIRFAASLPSGEISFLLQFPGLLLQRLTTCEPDKSQLEVAAAALAQALGEDNPPHVQNCGND